MAASIFTTDHGHTIKRAQEGIEASSKIPQQVKLTAKERAFWDQLVNYWRAQLKFAEKKGRKK